MNDIDLSHLLQEAPTPADGSERVRKIVRRRRQRQQAVAGGLGAVAIVGLSSVLAISSAGPSQPEVMFNQPANSAGEITTTTIASTTTVPIDPRSVYIGATFNGAGAGVPLGTQLKSWVDSSQMKLGDRRLFVAQDEQGAMVWVTKVVGLPKAAKPDSERYEVIGVINIATGPEDGQQVCANDCARNNGTVDPLVVAIFDYGDGWSEGTTSIRAYRVDLKTMTAKTIDAKGWAPKSHAPVTSEPEPTLSRPEAYKEAGSARSQEVVDRYEAIGILQRGYGAIDFATYGELRQLLDTRENKMVMVYTAPSGEVTDVFLTDNNGNRFVGAPMLGVSGGWAYKGKPSELTFALVNAADQPVEAYTVDPKTRKFVKVNVGDVTRVP